MEAKRKLLPVLWTTNARCRMGNAAKKIGGPQMNTWLIIALALYSLGITIMLLVAWNEGRPARKFIRSIEKAYKEREHRENQ